MFNMFYIAFILLLNIEMSSVELKYFLLDSFQDFVFYSISLKIS